MRLARDALLRLGRHELERPHVVEAVAELDEQHADVARHRDQHLAEVLGLPVFLRGEVDLAELGDAVDEERDLGAELALFDVLDGRQRVLDDVVEQPRADAGHVEPELGDDAGDGSRMDEVRLAATPLLTLVSAYAVLVCSRDQVYIRGGMVRSNTLD